MQVAVYEYYSPFYWLLKYFPNLLWKDIVCSVAEAPGTKTLYFNFVQVLKC